MSKSGLTFAVLRAANAARLPQFKNAKGELAHSHAEGADWSPAQWLQAVIGELGEFANTRKKFERGDLEFTEYMHLAARELADVQTYLDILARRCLDTPSSVHPHGIDLGQATVQKFNDISRRVKSTVFIDDNGASYFDVQRKDGHEVEPVQPVRARGGPFEVVNGCDEARPQHASVYRGG